MHWIDRGPEPSGLAGVRARHTAGWVHYYGDGIGAKPNDSGWREFREKVKQRFSSICAYCEAIDRGEIDHFRPKSQFPTLVYEWSNWVLACHSCNLAKGDKWPAEGYIDPCAASASDRPELFFTFDTLTGEIVPQDGLDYNSSRKARAMIDDLDLNGFHQLKRRQLMICILKELTPDDPNTGTQRPTNLIQVLSSRGAPLSSITRTWLDQRGYPSPGGEL